MFVLARSLVARTRWTRSFGGILPGEEGEVCAFRPRVALSTPDLPGGVRGGQGRGLNRSSGKLGAMLKPHSRVEQKSVTCCIGIAQLWKHMSAERRPAPNLGDNAGFSQWQCHESAISVQKWEWHPILDAKHCHKPTGMWCHLYTLYTQHAVPTIVTMVTMVTFSPVCWNQRVNMLWGVEAKGFAQRSRGLPKVLTFTSHNVSVPGCGNMVPLPPKVKGHFDQIAHEGRWQTGKKRGILCIWESSHNWPDIQTASH